MAAITFLEPELLWCLCLVPALWFWPRRARDPVHALLRSLVIACLVLALAKPAQLTLDDKEHQVFVVDLSPSALPKGQDLAIASLKTMLAGLEPEAKVKLIGLGLDRARLGDAALRFAQQEYLGPRAAGLSSLGTALASAALKIPDGARGAVTILSDGLATDPHWNEALQNLCARGIPVHTMRLPTAEDDVRPVAFDAAGVLRVGQTARLIVDIVGPEANLRLHLEDASGKVAETGVLSLLGRRQVALEFEPKQAGYLAVTAAVEVIAGPDSRSDNNRITGLFAVQDPLRVLYLGGRVRGSGQGLGTLLGRGFQLDSATDTDNEELDSYDLVMIDDRPAKDLPLEFQKQLVAAVTDQGLGMCMSGGSACFGPGGYHNTPLDSILPVEMVQKEEKKDPSTALAIIIDTSGSMGGNRIRLAKEVTRLALRRMLPHDKIGIVEFYGNKRWAAPLQSAANAIDIQRALNRLDAGGGTILFPAIEEAYYGLRNVQTRYKHVLVLTDAGVESGPYEQLLRRMARDGICVSTVLVGPGRHSEFLVELADWGRGRFYNASDRFNLPEIMLKQPSSARLPGYRSGVQPLEAKGGQGWWGETDPTAVPAVSGYVETRKRPGADVLLRTAPDRHPILASWRFGLGRVTAFTTEATGPGTAGWKDWEGYGPFLARVLSRTAAEGRLPFLFELQRQDNQLCLRARRLTKSHVQPFAQVAMAEERAVTFAFRERAPGLYEARLDWPPASPAKVLAGIEGQARGSIRLVSAAHADVASELQVDPKKALDLSAVARATGGTYLEPSDLPSFVPSSGGGSRPFAVRRLWPLCFLLALLFYLGDLLWRRSPWRRLAE